MKHLLWKGKEHDKIFPESPKTTDQGQKRGPPVLAINNQSQNEENAYNGSYNSSSECRIHGIKFALRLIQIDVFLFDTLKALLQTLLD